MKAMRAYNAEKSAEGALNDIIANVHFLYNKGLLNAASKELKKGIELGTKMENLPGLLILYQLKLNLTRVTQTTSDIKTADEDLESETRILKMLDTERKVVHARRKIFNFYITGQLKKKVTEVKIIMEELDKLDTKHSLTYKAQMSLLFLKAMIAEKEGRYLDAMKQYDQANTIWKKNELKLHESYSNLRVILQNYLACSHYAERFDVYPNIIKQIEEFPVQNVNEEADTFVVAKGARLVYLLNTPNKTDAAHLINEIEYGLNKFRSQIPRQETIYFYSNICMLQFQVLNYPGLVKSLNNAFAVIGRDDKMYSILFFLKFLEIMAQLSLKNYDLLDYQIRNTDRWLHEHNLNEAFTDLLIKSFSSLRAGARYLSIQNRIAEFNCSDNLKLLKSLVLDWIQINFGANKNSISGKSSVNQLA